jgi:hypothetical protein
LNKDSVAKNAGTTTLTRISNFRKAQIEILPSHNERGLLAQLFLNLRKDNINDKLFNGNILGIKQFNAPLSLCEREKFLSE